MVNRKQKGNRHEKEAMDVFSKEGYTVWKPSRSAIWIGKGRFVSKSQDIFNAFDFIAIKQDAKVMLVQVTTLSNNSTTHAKERRDKIDNVNLNYEHTTALCLARKRGGGWRIWKRDMLGWAEYDKPLNEII